MIGSVKIGGGNRVAVQSMTDTVTSDVQSTVNQILRLEKAGCDIVRVAVLNETDADAIKVIKKQVTIPVVADIHFNYKLAIKAIESGADKIRINPGNIGEKANLEKIVSAAKRHGAAIRIGVNSGSLDKQIEAELGRTAEALAQSALKHIKFFEELDFFNLVISVKSSSVLETIQANRIISSRTDYPLHIGVTESGFGELAQIKSAIGIGSLLADGIGDTIRVSLTDDPVKEVIAGIDILRAVGKAQYCEVISCPTCGRCAFNLKEIAVKVNRLAEEIEIPLKIAIMGCIVNGPGEAKHADIGLAGGGDGKAVIFKKGEIFKTVKSENAFDELKKEILGMANAVRGT